MLKWDKELEELAGKIKMSSETKLAPSAGCAVPQYAVRWLLASGGVAVEIGDWKKVVEVSTRWKEMGADEIEILRVVELPNNAKAQPREREL